MNESAISREIRENGERVRREAQWAVPLSWDERQELAHRLDRAAARFRIKHGGVFSAPGISASAEVRDLYIDVIERAAAPGAPSSLPATAPPN